MRTMRNIREIQDGKSQEKNMEDHVNGTDDD